MSWKIFLGIVGFCLLGLGCSTSAPDSKPWTQGMREMAGAYQKLLPFLFDQEAYSNENNRDTIEEQLEKLNEGAKTLDSHLGKWMSGNDPLFDIGLKGLRSKLRSAKTSYGVGSYGYSQNILQHSLNYCNSCHTRTSLGPTLVGWDQFDKIPLPSNPMDLVELQVALRQFPKAIETIEKSIVDKKLDEMQVRRGLKKLMVLYLRNRKDPKGALSSLAKIKKVLRKSQRQLVDRWIVSLKKIASQNQPMNRNQLVKKVQSKNFVEQVFESQQVHNYLSKEKTPLWRGRAYQRLGEIYQSQPGLGFWNLPETYFKTCIKETPGTRTAQRCYFSLENRVLKLDRQYHESDNVYVAKRNQSLKKWKVKAFSKPSIPSESFGGMGSEDW